MKYEKYAIAIEKSIPWIKEQIAKSKDGKIRMKIKDVKQEMGQEFENINETSIYWKLRPVLFDHDIVMDQGIHDASGDKLLIMRSRTEKDELSRSLKKYIDGEVLQIPKLDDIENSERLQPKNNIEEDPEKLDVLKKINNIEEDPEKLDVLKKINNIEEDPEKEIELSREKRIYESRSINSAVRDSSFRYRILSVYKARCAICGLQMNMVEACHIIPVEEDGTDEIKNGIALCYIHHKAFDSGLIWINEEYIIVLNNSKINDIKGANIAGGLEDFIRNSRIGEKIFLPDNEKFYPYPDYLTKKNNVYKSNHT